MNAEWILVLVIGTHWFLSLFAQTFFHHRYAAHRMFTMNPFWERVSYLLVFFAQGSSFLNPRAYAIMHRLHHAHSDTEKDPHSPMFHKTLPAMMFRTLQTYRGLLQRRIVPDKDLVGWAPEWKFLDNFGDFWLVRVTWGVLYVGLYAWFATEWWMFLFLPLHFLMGPIHGAIVNWCGHKYGYTNYDLDDHSRNTLVWDFLMLGELFQNNHHKWPNKINFACRWFEMDPTYPLLKILHWVRIIRLRPSHLME